MVSIIFLKEVCEICGRCNVLSFSTHTFLWIVLLFIWGSKAFRTFVHGDRSLQHKRIYKLATDRRLCVRQSG